MKKTALESASKTDMWRNSIDMTFDTRVHHNCMVCYGFHAEQVHRDLVLVWYQAIAACLMSRQHLDYDMTFKEQMVKKVWKQGPRVGVS